MAVAQPAVMASEPSCPHLETRHGVRQLIVDGKPFLILGGELHNSSSSSREYMKPIWPRLVEKKLNTVLAAVSWEQIESEEGKFDFSSVDSLIEDARRNKMHLVFLWFGSWKNGESSYPPAWVKTDPQRFPLAQNDKGKTLNILSTFGDATVDADARAFAALMRHIREMDGKEHTVLMMQVENEVGTIGDSRDRSPAANEAFGKPVPRELMDYLQQHKDTLAPELCKLWATNGFKTSGTWEEVFGPGKPASVKLYGDDLTQERKDVLWRQLSWPVDEIFMAWRYSAFVNKVAAAGKAEYDIPMYVNAWLQQPGCPRPGEYPSGGPVPQVHDIWRFGALSLDFLSPDLYIPQFSETCERFTRNGNPLFIPEADPGPQSAANALTALLKFNAIGFSPFGIDGRFRMQPADATNAVSADPLAGTYAVLDYLAPDILQNQGNGTIGLLPVAADTNAPPQEIKLGNYTIKIGIGVPPRWGSQITSSTTNSFPKRLVIGLGPDEFIFVGGGGMSASFTADTPGPKTVHWLSFDESILVDGRWVPGRRLNGDETGDNSRWPFMRGLSIYRVKVYRHD